MYIEKNIKQYIMPFLKENKFKLIEKGAISYAFQHNEHNFRIFFGIKRTNEFGSNGICCELWRGNKKDTLMSYDLSLFLDKPENIGDVFRDCFWYFDNEEEFIGALKEQREILSTQGFKWLFDELEYDIDKILKQKALERKKTYDYSTVEERKAILQRIKDQRYEWKRRRVR